MAEIELNMAKYSQIRPYWPPGYTPPSSTGRCTATARPCTAVGGSRAVLEARTLSLGGLETISDYC